MARPPSGTSPPPAPTHPPARGGPVPEGGRVFLDACVLYPAMVRSLLLAMAAEGGFVPLWSARVLEEWRRAIAKQHGDGAAREVEAAAARMGAAFPGADVPSDADLEARIELPDPGDAHVLAGAIAGQADILLTFNLRDFPARVTAAHGIEVRHPDGFLWERLSADPARIHDLTDRVLAEFDVPMDRGRAALKRARLSRFGKAWQSLGPRTDENAINQPMRE